jgi:hypothetical protein
MSARELVLGPSNGVITTLTFTETSLTVLSGSTTADTPKPHSFLFSSSTKPSHSEIPLHNVIAATVSGSTVEVSYLARTAKQHFHMKQIRGDVSGEDLPLATEWCSSITQAAYQGSRIADSVCLFSHTDRLPFFLHQGGNPSKTLKVLINPHGGPVGSLCRLDVPRLTIGRGERAKFSLKK